MQLPQEPVSVSDPLPQISLQLIGPSSNSFVMANVRTLDGSDRCRSHIMVPTVDIQYAPERIAHGPPVRWEGELLVESPLVRARISGGPQGPDKGGT
jgi:hypothetical protein